MDGSRKTKELHTSCLWMCAFRLVNWDGHGHQSNSPTCQNTSNKYHGKISGSGLQYSAYKIDRSSDHDSLSTTKTIHCETSPIHMLENSAKVIRSSYINDPNTAPPENVALMAPIVADVFVVLKNFRKFSD